MKNNVVTYQNTRGQKVNICLGCAAKLRKQGAWPGASGGPQTQVHWGAHRDWCDICEPEGLYPGEDGYQD